MPTRRLILRPSPSVSLNGPDPDPPVDPCLEYGTECYCDRNEGVWQDDHCVWINCPLLISLDNNASDYRLTSAEDGVLFDMFGSGLRRRMGWTAPDSDVAFIVRDLNGNGVIDSGAELFGNGTKRPDGSRFPNGFAALAALDANGDGRIDARDPAFAELQLWVDRNHNGISDPDELMSLTGAGIEVLYVASSPDVHVDRNGNKYFAKSSALITRGNSQAPVKVFDVIFIQ